MNKRKKAILARVTIKRKRKEKEKKGHPAGKMLIIVGTVFAQFG